MKLFCPNVSFDGWLVRMDGFRSNSLIMKSRCLPYGENPEQSYVKPNACVWYPGLNLAKPNLKSH